MFAPYRFTALNICWRIYSLARVSSTTSSQLLPCRPAARVRLAHFGILNPRGGKRYRRIDGTSLSQRNCLKTRTAKHPRGLSSRAGCVGPRPFIKVVPRLAVIGLPRHPRLEKPGCRALMPLQRLQVHRQRTLRCLAKRRADQGRSNTSWVGLTQTDLM